jgi:hypothetical protein
MATKPLWDLPPWEEIGHDPTKAERIETERRKREGRGHGRAPRFEREMRTSAGWPRCWPMRSKARSAQRERAMWIELHRAPTRSELETLKGMFPALNGRKARR